ncbi:MAG TPA: tetratricopeptide repeat protein, partial [Candidatus Wallbacteria bacterium]|nr:tetratricopeptide repeat protein [Candidatus Wallbacteria bacterium]
KFLESSALLNYNPASSKYELKPGYEPGSIKKALSGCGPAGLPGAAAGNLDAVTREVLKAASIFHGGFRCEEISACLQSGPAEIKNSLLKLRDAGILFQSPHGEIFRFAAPRCATLAASLCAQEECAVYNGRIIEHYIRAAGSLPNIGLGRLIYHSMKSGRVEETVLFARRLAESLCEIDAAGNALKLIRFIRMAVLNKAREKSAKLEELKFESELIYAKILILLGRFGAAHKILSRLGRSAPQDQASSEARAFSAEVYKWLGYVYMVKPSLAGEERDAALNAFMSALNRQMANPKKRIETTNLIALMHYHRSELEKASIFYRDSLKTLAMKKNEDGLWLELDSAQRGLSSVYLRQGEFRKALAYLKKCEELCAAADNKKMLANTYHYIGMLHHSRGEYNDAIQSYEKAIEISDKISDILAQSRIWTSLGVTHHNLANYKTALSFFTRSMQVALNTGNKKAMAILNGNIARVQAVLNNISAAYFALKEDIAILDETRDLYGLAHAYAYLGDAYYMDARDADAHEYYLKSFEISKKSQFLRPLILSACGLIQSTPPHLLSQRAQSIVNELMLIDSREIDIVSKSMILRARCAYETAGGTYHRATCFINQALINFEKMNMPLETALCLIDEANIMKLNGLFDMAESKKSYAIEIFNKIGAEYYAKKYRGDK